jgi:hypothetical protein
MRLFLFILTIAITTCGTHIQNCNKLIASADTVVVFSDHIIITGQHSDDFDGKSFKPIWVFLDNKVIFKDSLNEYWLTGYESTQYPKFLCCADGSCQLLIEVDERPNQNELVRLTIPKKGKLIQDRLPIFSWHPLDIDNDGKFEVDGILTNGETIANGDTAFYNPTLVYELMDNCLSLDSSATIEKNKKIWGQFKGYYYNDTLLLPFNRKEW